MKSFSSEQKGILVKGILEGYEIDSEGFLGGVLKSTLLGFPDFILFSLYKSVAPIDSISSNE